MSINTLSAYNVVCKFEMYCQYLSENNLPDDSFDISAEDVVSFVDEQFDDDEQEELHERYRHSLADPLLLRFKIKG